MSPCRVNETLHNTHTLYCILAKITFVQNQTSHTTPSHLLMRDSIMLCCVTARQGGSKSFFLQIARFVQGFNFPDFIQPLLLTSKRDLTFTPEYCS